MSSDINETPSTTPDFRTELAARLAELVPEAIADGKVDVTKLTELLAEDAGSESERFGLFWPGKRRALKAAQEPTTATLKPCPDLSKDWDTTQNVFIEGDNLEVLKILQRHYHGKIKMIYIDPPYNTGKDFVYPDNYKEGLQTYLEFTKQVDEGGKKLSTNSESEGRYHSNWLNMMYPRLKLARNLLALDGVIAISIDDTELPHLRRLGDEVFGERNFYATVVWQKKYSPANDAKRFSDVHDYVVLYARSDQFVRRLFPRTAENNKPYRFDDGDGRGLYRTGDLSVRTYSAANDFPITNPNTGDEHLPPSGGCWRYSKDGIQRLISENRIYWGKDGTGAPQLKRYLSEVQQGTVPMTLWSHEFAGHTDGARKEVKDLFGTSAYFDTPKATKLMQRLLQVCTSPEEGHIVLDFFAGSGTTAHAVMQQNAEDNGNRSFVQVQLPEPLDRSGDDLRTIADVARKRIDLAGDKIKAELDGQLTDRDDLLDIGYRTYKLVDTNFTKWRVSSDVESDALEQHLLDLRDSSNDEATADDLLTEILLKQGHSLTERVETVDVAGLDVRSVGDNLLLAYLDEHTKPTLEQLRAMADTAGAKIVILEDAFQGDDELKTNMVQLCKTKNIELWTA